jgi:hypothetical protein
VMRPRIPAEQFRPYRTKILEDMMERRAHVRRLPSSPPSLRWPRAPGLAVLRQGRRLRRESTRACHDRRTTRHTDELPTITRDASADLEGLYDFKSPAGCCAHGKGFNFPDSGSMAR